MNTELKKAKRLFEGEIMGPEAFVVDKDGRNNNFMLREDAVPIFSYMLQVICTLDLGMGEW